MYIPKKHIYDVCVIGSGAAGGFMAKELSEAGAKTILLEAGRKVEPEELRIHDRPYQLPRQGYKFNRQAPLYPDEIEKSIEYQTRERIAVDRIRTLGGRTVHWNAVCLRFSEDDFRERSINGIEEDWPLSYQELAPFYSYVEKVMGVCGTREGLKEVPDGDFVARPPKLRCAEVIAGKACEKLGIKLIPTRKALSIDGYDGRPACHYCGHCMDVCDVGAIFTSANSLIPKALKTGNLTLRTNALARQLLIDKAGRVSAVSIIDRITRKQEEIYARVVVVSCATIESARLLLNSACEKFPNGLGNSNDLVGRYLHGHSGGSVIGYLKDLVGTTLEKSPGATDHSYIPRFRRGRKPGDYKGGFGVQLQFINLKYPHHAHALPGFGTKFKQRVRDLQPAMLHLGGFGKVLARRENRVTVDPKKFDAFGIPIPIVNFGFCDNDRALFSGMIQDLREILDAAGMALMLDSPTLVSGFASHEVGTCRMGRDPKTSVLNSYCQTHQIPNLFVVDGSCFTTSPEKNPTLTIAALAVRSARYIAQKTRRGEL
ncbi:MAG TPA: GMC family oxidoreductase [Acidobacteriota bacterium]|jgi:choline dehydrogenase-like flavoprotein|nr:GMC family oxidoreductase [Acidobacteriota bacterium]